MRTSGRPRNAKRRKDNAKRKKWQKCVKIHARNVPQLQQPLQLQQPQVRNSTINFDQYTVRPNAGNLLKYFFFRYFRLSRKHTR